MTSPRSVPHESDGIPPDLYPAQYGGSRECAVGCCNDVKLAKVVSKHSFSFSSVSVSASFRTDNRHFQTSTGQHTWGARAQSLHSQDEVCSLATWGSPGRLLECSTFDLTPHVVIHEPAFYQDPR